MKLLLVHGEDDLPQRTNHGRWDLVVDCARAPQSTYDRWSALTGSQVSSLYSLAREAEDLWLIREILQKGLGGMVDQRGIDWWDVLSLMIATDIGTAILIERLAAQLPRNTCVYSTRPNSVARSLCTAIGATPVNLRDEDRSLRRRLTERRKALERLNFPQALQVMQDKYDPEHRLRRMFAKRSTGSSRPVFLLPSAYINVSRTALAYAQLLPEEEFLLVMGRTIARPDSDLPNVRVTSLDGYFSREGSELQGQLELWSELRHKLASQSQTFRIADDLGALARIPQLLPWGLALADAWAQVFVRENVMGCLCADDSNPYSRIPLILAKKNGIAALACHHGALDLSMAFKTRYSDRYLAKGVMEKDYLERICKVPESDVAIGAPASAHPCHTPVAASTEGRSWLVLFTEPYHVLGWRTEEVYRDLLPALHTLAKACSLELVFKLHPFESAKAHRRLLAGYLPSSEAQRSRILAGPIPPDLWTRTRFAITAQSSVALQCADFGIPVFLCGWLRDPYSGYVSQYLRFGVGRFLNSPEAIADIPRLLKETPTTTLAGPSQFPPMDPKALRDMLYGARLSSPDEVNAKIHKSG